MKPTVLIHYREDGEIMVSATAGIRVLEIDESDETNPVHEYEGMDDASYIAMVLDSFDVAVEDGEIPPLLSAMEG